MTVLGTPFPSSTLNDNPKRSVRKSVPDRAPSQIPRRVSLGSRADSFLPREIPGRGNLRGCRGDRTRG